MTVDQRLVQFVNYRVAQKVMPLWLLTWVKCLKQLASYKLTGTSVVTKWAHLLGHPVNMWTV